ncbi:putative ATP-grasp-modified RiPP [Actinomadura flavalba]|uniref:putative ATP-grasp-modified RiPP n=1 Tax=Actinomadura flavalba TaxID=1120938 RepID=UPI0003727CF1|nr:putative ATP-grasp-modified RiPP [Actinomadura flavalba]
MSTLVPWGLSRLAPFPTVSAIPAYVMELDPATQTGRAVLADGSVITAGHRKSGTSGETKTSASKGDGRDHKQYDTDNDQSGDED